MQSYDLQPVAWVEWLYLSCTSVYKFIQKEKEKKEK